MNRNKGLDRSRLRRLALGSIVVMGGVGATGAIVAGPATARSSFGDRFTLRVRTTNNELGFVKNLQEAQHGRFAPGDTIIEREEFRLGATVVGYDNLSCTATFNDNVLCTIVTVFPGRGTLDETVLIHTTTANASGFDPVDTVVTGGTGIFANKRGTVHAVGVGEGERTATYRLVG